MASQPRWRAAPGCPETLRYLIEKTVNAYPPRWIDPPITGEIFESVDECRDRLIAFSFASGFDVVKSHSDSARQTATFSCVHHGIETRNTRRLPREVERDEEGAIIGERKRQLTIVRQTDCRWCCKVAFKSLGKRGKSEKAFVLTAISTSHNHPLTTNPLIYRQHRERLKIFQVLKAQAQTHRISVLPYSLSRRVLDAADGIGLSLSRREYYNLQKYQVFNDRDEKTIEGLLFALDEAGFQYRCRVQEDLDGDVVVSKKLVQIWFTHPKLLYESALFVAGCVCLIDATFNINKVNIGKKCRPPLRALGYPWAY